MSKVKITVSIGLRIILAGLLSVIFSPLFLRDFAPNIINATEYASLAFIALGLVIMVIGFTHNATRK